MSKSSYVGGLAFLGLCLAASTTLLVLVWAGHVGLAQDRAASVRGVAEISIVFVLMMGTWMLIYRLRRTK